MLSIFVMMRKRMTITLDDDLYKALIKKAGKEKSSISSIIEMVLIKTEFPKKGSKFLAILDSLPPPRIPKSAYSKK